MLEINKKLIPKGKTLYDNSNGTNGTVTLSDSLVNYQYIDIHFYITDGEIDDFMRVHNPNGKTIRYNRVEVTANNYYILSKLYSCLNNTITKGDNYVFIKDTGTHSTYDNTRIVKVIGYR